MSDMHVIRGRRTTHAAARAVAEELGRAVVYWPFYPSPEAHTVYPPKPSTRGPANPPGHRRAAEPDR